MLVLQELLEKIGLSDKETRVYLAALELGAQPASTFSKKAHLNRTTSYAVLKSLLNKGLMSSLVKNGVSRYEAVAPSALLRFVENRKVHFEECRREIEHYLPTFESLGNSLLKRPKVKYFEGLEGVKAVMEDTLKSSEPLRCYSSLHKWFDGPLSSYVKDYGKRRIFEAELPLKALVYDDPAARKYLKSEYPNVHHEYRFVPNYLDIESNEVNIYDDKIAIVSLKEEDFFGVIIESIQVANSQKSIFEMAWQVAEKP